MADFKHPINDSLNKILDRLDYLIKQSKLKNIQDPKYVILDNADILQLFKISSKTASNWREEGILPYSQIKGKLYYKLSDIHSIIDNHYSGNKTQS